MAGKRRRRRRSKGRTGLGVWAPTHWLGWPSVLLRAGAVLDNVALRQQLGLLRRAVRRPGVTLRPGYAPLFITSV